METLERCTITPIEWLKDDDNQKIDGDTNLAVFCTYTTQFDYDPDDDGNDKGY